MSSPLKVMIACSGLGRVRRGFESFADECFDALRRSEHISPCLLHGPGEVSRTDEFAVRLIPHQARWVQAYGWLRGRGHKGRQHYEAFDIEQASFGISVAHHAAKHGTEVILFSELLLGSTLDRFRRIFGLRYRTLFSNGGPHPPPFPGCDHVQQVTPSAMDFACGRGVLTGIQSLVPYGFSIPARGPVDKTALRRRLNLPVERPVLISVAAINRSHKRIDYLIDETAALGSQRPYVLFLGEVDDESASIKAQAAAALGDANCRFASVSSANIGAYYQASDLFVLTSVREGFGRVLVEAMSYGLPCLVHDYPITRFVLGQMGIYANFAETGALSGLLRASLGNLAGIEKLAAQRQAFVRDLFSWDHLLPAYEQMLFAAAGKSLT